MKAAKMCGIIISASIVLYVAAAGPACRYASRDVLPHPDTKGCYDTLYFPLEWLSRKAPTLMKPYRAYLDRWCPPPQELPINLPHHENSN